MANTNLTTLIRFASSVDIDWVKSRVRITENGCWEWTGDHDKNGYGRYGIHGQPIRIHRLVVLLVHGEASLRGGAIVCHHCDNPPCCNPDHLYPGTISDNIRDAIARGRFIPPQCGIEGKCKRGHEWTPENTMYSKGARLCKTCHRMRGRAYEQTAQGRLRQAERARERRRLKYEATGIKPRIGRPPKLKRENAEGERVATISGGLLNPQDERGADTRGA